MIKQYLLLFVLSILIFESKAQNNKPALPTEPVRARMMFYGNYQDWREYPTATVKLLPNYKPAAMPDKISKYGGTKSKKVETTGFYHVKKVGNRWWAVDPEGHLFIHQAVSGVAPGDSDRNKKALQEKFGTEAKWMNQTSLKLQELGFNGLGAWSRVPLIRETPNQKKKPLSYCVMLNFMSSYGKKRGGTHAEAGHVGYPNQTIFIFDPEFEIFCDTYARQVAQYKDDPNLFGYFSDNEMPFPKNLLDRYINLTDKNDHGHKAAWKWVNDRKLGLEDINDSLRFAFQAEVAERYLSLVRNALKKYDPNHMYLGARFYGDETRTKEFLEAAGKYVDILSINFYSHWAPPARLMHNWTKWSGRPFIIAEYYTKGEDSGLPNKTGAGWIVKTQEDRGKHYQNFSLQLLQSGNCVGWHSFKYQDNDPEQKGAELSNIDSNKGMVDYKYDYWQGFVEKQKELNQQVYSIIDYLDKR